MYGYTILEELDNLCYPTGYVASSDKDTSKTQKRGNRSEKDKERAIVCGHHLQNHSLLEGCCCCLSDAPVVIFIYAYTSSLDRLISLNFD